MLRVTYGASCNSIVKNLVLSTHFPLVSLASKSIRKETHLLISLFVTKLFFFVHVMLLIDLFFFELRVASLSLLEFLVISVMADLFDLQETV